MFPRHLLHLQAPAITALALALSATTVPVLAATNPIVARSPVEGEKSFSEVLPPPAEEQLRNLGLEAVHERIFDPSLAPAVSLLPQGSCPRNSIGLLATFNSSPVQWRICVESTCNKCGANQASKGIGLGPVDIKRNSSAPFMRVLYDAGIAEIITAYDSGNPCPHFRDMQFADCCNWKQPVTVQDAPGAFLLGFPKDPTNCPPLGTQPTLVVEPRSRGLGYLCKSSGPNSTVRGEEVVVWSVYDTGNYDYIIEYGFKDDGTITFRFGASGYNSPPQPFEPHMHTALFRLDLDLNGPSRDFATLNRHIETGPVNVCTASEGPLPFPNGACTEGQAQFVQNEFTTLTITDMLTPNIFGNRRGYELHPLLSGTPRHYGPNEAWTRSDFWVTLYNSANDTNLMCPWNDVDNYLLPDVNTASNFCPLGNDLVLWYVSGAHHDPTDEDRWRNDTAGTLTGITLMHWAGFDLVPHNLFDNNPLYDPNSYPLTGPPRCDP